MGDQHKLRNRSNIIDHLANTETYDFTEDGTGRTGRVVVKATEHTRKAAEEKINSGHVFWDDEE